MGKNRYCDGSRGNLNKDSKERTYGEKRKHARPNPKKGYGRDGGSKIWQSLGISPEQDAINRIDKRIAEKEKLDDAYNKAGLANYSIIENPNDALTELKSTKNLYEEATGIKLNWLGGDGKEEFWRNYIKIASALELYRNKGSTDFNSKEYFQYATRFCLIAADYYIRRDEKNLAKKYLAIVDTIVKENGLQLSHEDVSYSQKLYKKADN